MTSCSLQNSKFLHRRLHSQFRNHVLHAENCLACGTVFCEKKKESCVGRVKRHSAILQPTSEAKPCFNARSCVLRMTGKMAYIRRDISISFPYLVPICSEWLVKDVPKIRTTAWERNPRTCSNDLSFSFLASATIWSKMAFINFYKIAKRKIPQDTLISTKTQNLNKQSNSHDWQ